jgi:hypothetical protein
MEAFRSGGGVPYAEYDADFCEGQAEMNRVQFINLLGSEWLPAVPGYRDIPQIDTILTTPFCGLSLTDYLSTAAAVRRAAEC